MIRPVSALAATLLASFAFQAQGAEGQAHWEYTGHGGARHWGDLDPAFATCKLGHEQSPIDIRGATKAALPALGFAYTSGAAEVVNNGHTIQVNLPAAGTATLAGGDYTLVQFHFHTPSEEAVDGKRYPMVAHLVHKNAEGKLAVVGVLFRVGRKNDALAPVFAAMPKKAGEKAALAEGFDPARLLPADKGYWAFTGSLTTPPCSEGVRWQVMKQPLEISAAQLKAFRTLYKMNARPIQPLNGRTLEESH